MEPLNWVNDDFKAQIFFEIYLLLASTYHVVKASTNQNALKRQVMHEISKANQQTEAFLWKNTYNLRRYVLYSYFQLTKSLATTSSMSYWRQLKAAVPASIVCLDAKKIRYGLRPLSEYKDAIFWFPAVVVDGKHLFGIICAEPTSLEDLSIELFISDYISHMSYTLEQHAAKYTTITLVLSGRISSGTLSLIRELASERLTLSVTITYIAQFGGPQYRNFASLEIVKGIKPSFKFRSSFNNFIKKSVLFDSDIHYGTDNKRWSLLRSYFVFDEVLLQSERDLLRPVLDSLRAITNADFSETDLKSKVSDLLVLNSFVENERMRMNGKLLDPPENLSECLRMLSYNNAISSEEWSLHDSALSGPALSAWGHLCLVGVSSALSKITGESVSEYFRDKTVFILSGRAWRDEQRMGLAMTPNELKRRLTAYYDRASSAVSNHAHKHLPLDSFLNVAKDLQSNYTNFRSADVANGSDDLCFDLFVDSFIKDVVNGKEYTLKESVTPTHPLRFRIETISSEFLQYGGQRTDEDTCYNLYWSNHNSERSIELKSTNKRYFPAGPTYRTFTFDLYFQNLITKIEKTKKPYFWKLTKRILYEYFTTLAFLASIHNSPAPSVFCSKIVDSLQESSLDLVTMFFHWQKEFVGIFDGANAYIKEICSYKVSRQVKASVRDVLSKETTLTAREKILNLQILESTNGMLLSLREVYGFLQNFLLGVKKDGENDVHSYFAKQLVDSSISMLVIEPDCDPRYTCKLIYVILENDEIYINYERDPDTSERPTHSELASGFSVKAAGEILFEYEHADSVFGSNGWHLIEINNGSGHYRPPACESLPVAKRIIVDRLQKFWPELVTYRTNPNSPLSSQLPSLKHYSKPGLGVPS